MGFMQRKLRPACQVYDLFANIHHVASLNLRRNLDHGISGRTRHEQNVRRLLLDITSHRERLFELR